MMTKTFRPLGIFALFLVFATWFYFLTSVSTFDFDESLYRRVAEEMKHSGNPWHLTWDGRPLYHKPPIFYWLICLFSYVVDGANASVSSLAARLPSFFASIGILISLFFGTKKVMGIKEISSPGKVSVLAFVSAVFPVMTATAVFFDPLQTLLLLPSLFIPAMLFFQEKELTAKDWAIWAMSLFLACSVKGLNGIVIPSFAFAIHLLFHLKSWGIKKVVKIKLQFFFFAFLPALALTLGFYYLLDYKIGAAFTNEFIWVQHFARTSAPMENHSGSILYHPLIIFFGGGFLIPILLENIFSTRLKFRNYGFPLTYALSFITVFTLSATKLPHYTWPVWPALALACGILTKTKDESARDESRITPLHRRLRVLSTLPVLNLGIMLLLLLNARDILVAAFPANQIILAMAPFVPSLNFGERSCLNLGAVACFLFIIRKKRFLHNIEATSALAAFVSFCLTLGLGQSIGEVLNKPYQEIAAELLALHPTPAECIRYSGAQSPTLSLALGTEITHNNCEPATLKYLIAPVWKSKECEDRGLTRIARKSYLVLCSKK